MRIDNTPFDNFPIEFKEINPEDFTIAFNEDGSTRRRNDFVVENDSSKIIIEPNEDGYINDAFQSEVNIHHKNTVILNAAVGQGKSYSIIQTVKSYFDYSQGQDQKYLILVASPFVSLVKQYCLDIEGAGVPEEEIFNYGRLGREENPDYFTKTVQVLTVNTLLGNPGEDAYINSEVKRDYINSLVEHCEINDIRVVIVYDEIHDSYQNFKMKYIFSLWKWRNVIHKNFVLSATFNEASKVIIEYLAELTEKRIKIIESKRERRIDSQSSLYLHYSSQYNFNEDNIGLKELVRKLLSEDKKIDILTYSRKLAKSIITSSTGKLLKDKFGAINDCTSELRFNEREENVEPQNQYDNQKCNVGTNFKTGVSINKDSHAYIIIMPPRASKAGFKNKYGIFSGGINSVIQSLARQRKKGEIHIILAKPEQFNYESLEYSGMTNDQVDYFKSMYNKVCLSKPPKKVGKYFNFNRQDLLIRNFYKHQLKKSVISEIQHISSIEDRGELPNLRFPTYKEFKIEEGEDYLASQYPFFGEDISSYITYAALANQFMNCKLVELNFKTTLYFKETNVLEKLDAYVDKYIGGESLNYFLSFETFYNHIRNQLFQRFDLVWIQNDDKLKKINSYNHQLFEKSLLFYCLDKYYSIQDSTGDRLTRSKYLLNSIAFYKNLDEEEFNENQIIVDKIKFYKYLEHFREKLINSIREYSRREPHYYYLPKKPQEDFFNEVDKLKFRELERLISCDVFLGKNIFQFKRRIESQSNLTNKLRAFYKIMIEDFVILDLTSPQNPRIQLNSGERNYVFKVSSVNILPFKIIEFHSEDRFISKNIESLESHLNDDYESLDKYNEIINQKLDDF